MRTRRLVGICSVLVAALAAGGCSDDDSSADPAPTTSVAVSLDDTITPEAAATTTSSTSAPAQTTVPPSATTTVAATDDSSGSDRIEVVEIPLPDGVSIPSQQNSSGFTHDGSRLFTTVLIDGIDGRHLATMARDGSDFVCLTCADLESPELDLRQPQLAHDGRRFAVRNGSEEQRHAIIECTPTALECDTAILVPVELPLGVVPLLRNAQMRIAPDGDHVLFTHVRADGLLVPVFGNLERAEDGYIVSGARALAGFRPTFTGPTDDLELAIGNWGEAKGFTDGGASVLYYTTIDSFNYDSVKLDLATGQLTRLTSHPEYDEDVHLSPDGAWIATSSYRNYERMSAFSLVPRPPIIDAALRGPVALLRNQAERRFFDIFILPTGQPDDESARQLLGDQPNDLDVNTRGQGRWSPDSTEFVFIDERSGDLGSAALRLATFVDRDPTPPLETVTSPEPTWAPLIDGATSPSESTTGTLPGPESGTADIIFDLDLAPLAADVDITVNYSDYSADGCSFLNGVERATVDGLDFIWTADLEITGCHEGSLTADISGIVFPAHAEGSIVAEYDGARVEGVPER